MLNRTSGRDRLAALVVLATVAIAVLYPQSFFSTDYLLGNKWLDPLAAMIVPMAIMAAVCLKSRWRELKLSAVDALVLVFAAYLVLQSLAGPAVLVTLKYVALGLGTYYLTTLLSARGEGLRKPLLYTVVGLTLLTSLYGLLEYALQKNIIFAQLISQSVLEPAHGVHRAGSTLAHPVPFGVFLLQAMPFSAMLLMMSRRWWKRLLALSVLSLAAAALFFSYSKGSWIVGGILAAAALLLVLRTRNRRAVIASLVVLALLGVAFAGSWTTVKKEVDNRSDISIIGRETAWRGAIAGIEKHPLGVGLFQGSTEIRSQLRGTWAATGGQLLAIDNYYLDLPLEAGIAGFILWAVMMIMIFREGIGVARVRGPSQLWALGALAGMAAICLNAFTVDAFLLWPNYLVFWMTAGLIHGIVWHGDKQV